MSETSMPKQELTRPSVEIERAAPDDAEIICDIRDRAWIDTYPNLELGITRDDIEINAKGLHGEFVPRRIAYIKENLAKVDRSDSATFVAKTNGKVLGFVDPTIEDGKRHISAIYVDPEAQGRGVGSKLMQRALEWHGRGQDIFLEVVAYNQNAISFYKRFGFEQTDTVVQEDLEKPDIMISLPQIEMVLRAETKEQK